MLEQAKNKKAIAVVKVTEANTAKTMGSGSLDVFATPALVAVCEEAACNAIAEFLDEDKTTVGTNMNINHNAATPLNMTVTATATLVKVEGKKLIFEVSATDGVDEIATGSHERFVVEKEKFMNRANSKTN